jgi:WD40 repeat protein
LGSPLADDVGSTLFSDRITALDFSPDGQSLAIGSGPPSRFGEVKIVAIATGEVQRDFGEAHSDTVLGLRYPPDGRQLATCGADKLCRLYQLDSGQLLRSFEGHTHHVLGVSWQNNGQTLATASADNSVKSWNVATGERKQSIAGFGKEVTGIEFVGLTDQVVTSSVDGQARLHNASNAQLVRAFAGANTALYTVSASDDGLFIVAGGQSGQVWIWKLADGALVRKIPEDPK